MSKRDDIFSAALELFAGRGFYGTPVPLIAERAGVGAGTIYRYFESKEKLVNELFRHWKQKMHDSFQRDVSFDLPAREVFHQVWGRMVEFSWNNQTVLTFLEMHHHAPYLDQQSSELSGRVMDSLGMYFVRTQQEQITKDLPPQLLLDIFWGMFLGMMKAHWTGKIKLTPELIDQVEGICWEALRR